MSEWPTLESRHADRRRAHAQQMREFILARLDEEAHGRFAFLHRRWRANIHELTLETRSVDPPWRITLLSLYGCARHWRKHPDFRRDWYPTY